ncbi:hypothetical protein BT69DRAFT_1300750 [Atractiella rhizophila]|nr:hypothetical protein BT69DRAFT_1300750 [Atractiella rhizophila]
MQTGKEDLIHGEHQSAIGDIIQQTEKEIEDIEEEIKRDLVKAVRNYHWKAFGEDEKDLSVLEWIKKKLELTEEDNALKNIPDKGKVMKGLLKAEKKMDNVG